MAGVAYNGSTIAESIKSSYVSYTEQVWNPFKYYHPQTCYDEEGNPYDCSYYEGGYDNYNWNTDARINGSIISSSNVYVNGKPVVTQSSQTDEDWVADPMPYPHNGGSIINISPGTSGSGTGTVSIGNSSNVYVNGKSVAQIGSEVTTHLGTTTTITSGSNNVFIG